MALPTPEQITSLYLYGSWTKPTNIATEELIRNKDDKTQISLSLSEYMAGPGRFVNAASFDLINVFMDPDAYADIFPNAVLASKNLAQGTYAKKDLANMLGLGKIFVDLQQYNYGATEADYVERAYVWGSSAYKIADETNFHVKSNGDREILNFAIVYHSNDGNTENFDFESDNLLTQIVNIPVEQRIDRSRIGREVVIAFDDDVVRQPVFTFSDYVAAVGTKPVPQTNILGLISQVDSLLNGFLASGLTDFRDGDREIAYGTLDNDALSAASAAYGALLIGGAGNDTLMGANSRDELVGNSGNDSLDGGGEADVLHGGIGNDTLHGGADADLIYGDDGNDSLQGGSGIDNLYGGMGNDTLDGADGNGGDLLEGGEGHDVYRVDDGDTIIDEDGKGEVWLNGKRLTFAVREEGEAEYEDSQGNAFLWSGSTLLVNDPLTITGFQNGQFGIYLDVKDDPNPKKKPDYDPNRRRIDPLALDLNNSGSIETISSLQSSAYFDFNGDGIAERAGWVAPHDGILTFDTNGNGVVDNLSELFGSAAKDGFIDLRDRIDSNSDGVIDNADDDFGKLKVWLDANSDGISQTGELFGLGELGISKITLTATATRIVDRDNVIAAVGSFTRNGTERIIADVELNVDMSITSANPYRALNQYPQLDADVFDLPWLRGYGYVASSNLAYQSNSPLKSLAANFSNQGWQQILANFDEFMSVWTGLKASHDAKGVTRSTISLEDKVWMLETLMGVSQNKPFIEAAAFAPGVIPRGLDETYIDTQYANFRDRAALTFAIQATSKVWLKGAYFSLGKDSFIVTDMPALQQSLSTKLAAAEQGQDLEFVWQVIRRLKFDGINLSQDLLEAGFLRPFSADMASIGALSFANQGQELILSPTSNGERSVGIGTDARDRISGSVSSDILLGGPGSDVLLGGDGADTYLYQLGDGQDTIFDCDQSTAKIDTIRFGPGILPSDFVVNRDRYNLYFSIPNSNDRVTIQSWADVLSRAEHFEFENGVVWSAQDIIAMTSLPDENPNQIFGLEGNEFLEGGGANDTIFGAVGNDTLVGGTGADYLIGESGDDVYVFNRGDGSDKISDVDSTEGNIDTLRFGAGIIPSDVVVRRNYGGLLLRIIGSTDQVFIEGWAENSAFNLERIQFQNGVTWNIDDLIAASMLPTIGADDIVGTDGDNHLEGLAGDDSLDGGTFGIDTLDGGTGNDKLEGNLGGDIYIFARGYGEDTIYESVATDADIDKVILAADIFPNDVRVYRSGMNLVLAIVGTEDKLILDSWYVNDSRKIEEVRFANGTIWGRQDLENGLLIGSPGPDTLIGTALADSLMGYGGDDTIAGGAGDDSLFGGAGNDQITDGPGNDLVDGGAGNDWISDGLGNDFIDGGEGNDILYLGEGNNVIAFGRGYGDDQILANFASEDAMNVIRFGPNVSAGDLVVNRNVSYVSIGIKGTDDLLTISNYIMQNGAYGFSAVEFGSGSSLTFQELLLQATEDADSLVGGVSNDSIRGLGGNDTLFGGDGNDYLEGGAGLDSIQGGKGSDRYFYKLGDGSDVIYDDDQTVGNADTLQFDSSISKSDVVFHRDQFHLYLTIVSSQEVIKLANWFKSDLEKVELIEFADGTVWNVLDLEAKSSNGTPGPDILTVTSNNSVLNGLGSNDQLTGAASADKLSGGQGNDVLIGGAGADTLIGGAGFDYLEGGIGNDVYEYSLGDGIDSIREDDQLGGNVDTLRFDASILPGDVHVRQEGSSVVITTSEPNDVIQLENWVLGDRYQIERIEFHDGTIWGIAEISEKLVVSPTSGDDTLFGTAANDHISGDAGNDQLNGLSGHDTLVGGRGNDQLYGGAGNDNYLFSRGDGQDVINDFDPDPNAGGYDSIVFGETISPDDVELSIDTWKQLTISIKGTSDQIFVPSWISGPYVSINQIQFHDGTFWDLGQMLQRVGGTDNADTMQGDSAPNTLNGRGGDDLLYGAGGEDTLEGGTGSDYLQGDQGNDTYLFARGHGVDVIYEYGNTVSSADVIRYQSGVSPSDIAVSVAQDSLVLKIVGTTDEVTVTGYMEGEGHKIGSIQFADGTVWTKADIAAKLAPPSGTLGNDTIIGTSCVDIFNGLGGDDSIAGAGGNDSLLGGDGNDTLSGGAGDDFLSGGVGSDVYVFNLGDGVDVIGFDGPTNGSIDTLRFGSGILPTSLQLQINGPNLEIAISDLNDKITLTQWASHADSRVSRFEFADGSFWNIAELLAMLPPFTTIGNDIVVGTAGNDNINGQGGNDSISGMGGNDSLIGGDGNDTLSGGVGDDFVTGGSGSEVYLFNLGDGVDTIGFDGPTDGAIDTLRLGPGILATALQLQVNGPHLEIVISGTSDKITLAQWVSDPNSRLARIEFADGALWTVADVLGKLLPLGTSGADSLTGSGGDDSLSGFGGNDIISGADGNDLLDGGDGGDTLSGGRGNDTLDGGFGNDVFLFSLGDGNDVLNDWDPTTGNQDTLRFGADIAPDDVQVRRDNYSLYLTINGTSDQLRINGWVSGDASKIERIEFANGTVWTVADLFSKVPAIPTASADTITGTAAADYLEGLEGNDSLAGMAGDDYVAGGEGNDTLVGGTGNDFVSGGVGDDVFVFNLGDGADFIAFDGPSNGNVDTLRFGPGIQPSGIEVSSDDYHLQISIPGTEDKVVVLNWISNPDGRLARFEFANGTVWTIADVLSKLPALPTEGNDTIIGTGVNDSFNGQAGDDSISGLGGHDTLVGGEGNDTLLGGAGDDSLDGGAGNDSLTAGAGVDTLNGGVGSDVYVFNAGDGTDVIYDSDSSSGNQDTLRFGPGISPANIQVTKAGPNLNLAISGTSDQVTIISWLDSDMSKIERIEFTDGTVWNVETILAMLPPMPTNGNDLLSGSTSDDGISGLAGNDRINGLAGNDYLFGDDGNDTLSGGVGDDYLDGGAGDDTYLFNLGDGFDVVTDLDPTVGNQDTLRFGPGISPSDIYVSKDSNSLYLSINGTSDQVRMNDWTNSDAYKIERIEFANGTVWTTEDLRSKLPSEPSPGDDQLVGTGGGDYIDAQGGNDAISGVEGDDYLVGSGGNDTLTGGIGNDQLEGGGGNDVYIFNRGDGDDLIYQGGDESEDIDVIRFGPGIAPADVTVTRSTFGLALTVSNGGGHIALPDWFNGVFKIDQIQFEGGAVWSTADIEQHIDLTATSEGDDYVEATEADDLIDGLSGDDELYGADGDDTIKGGEGNDHLYGDAGDDRLEGGDDSDELYGGVGDDTLIGGAGEDSLYDDYGSNTFVFEPGFGVDYVEIYGSLEDSPTNTLHFTGVAPADLVISKSAWEFVIRVKGTGDYVYVNGLEDGEVAADTTLNSLHIRFDDGTDWNIQQIQQHLSLTTATQQDDHLFVEGSGLYLNGLAGSDSFTSVNGENFLQGGDGEDWFEVLAGNNLLVGGNDEDGVGAAGGGSNIFVGGKARDSLQNAAGGLLYLFNKGDGDDYFSLYGDSGANKTISLGAGIKYDDLKLSRQSNDLILAMGDGDEIRFAGWYANGGAQGDIVLQVIVDSMAEYSGNSTNILLNKRVVQFDFDALVNTFDQALIATPSLNLWSMANSMLEKHLHGSDTAAIGGDLAYTFGKNGTLPSALDTTVQALLASGQYSSISHRTSITS